MWRKIWYYLTTTRRERDHDRYVDLLGREYLDLAAELGGKPADWFTRATPWWANEGRWKQTDEDHRQILLSPPPALIPVVNQSFHPRMVFFYATPGINPPDAYRRACVTGGRDEENT